MNHYFCLLFIYSYLPSIIAASFCRGLSTSHTAAAGRPFKCAEVWKLCPRCFRAGADCRDELVFRKLQGNSGGPFLADMAKWPKSLTKGALTVLWQLTVCTLFTLYPACMYTWRHRERFTGRKQKRLFFKTLTQRGTILLSSALPYLLCGSPICCCPSHRRRLISRIRVGWSSTFSCKAFSCLYGYSTFTLAYTVYTPYYHAYRPCSVNVIATTSIVVSCKQFTKVRNMTSKPWINFFRHYYTWKNTHNLFYV